MGTLQLRRSQQVGLLKSDFPTKGPLDQLSMVIAAHLAIPGLRGFWPMSAYSQAMYPVSIGPSRDLTSAAGNVPGLTTGLCPYATLASASSQYLYRADETGLRGSGMNWTGSNGGMTWGGWFKFASLPTAGNYMGLISKWGGSNATNEYLLMLQNIAGTQILQCEIGNGSAPQVLNVAYTPTIGTWVHVVGRWIASTTIDLYINGAKSTNATSYASLAGGVTNFNIGALANGYFLDGSTTLDFVAGYPLSDTHINELCRIAMPLFP